RAAPIEHGNRALVEKRAHHRLDARLAQRRKVLFEAKAGGGDRGRIRREHEQVHAAVFWAGAGAAGPFIASDKSRLVSRRAPSARRLYTPNEVKMKRMMKICDRWRKPEPTLPCMSA